MTEWLLPFLVGTVTGVLSGFGVGGGSLLLIYLSNFTGMAQHAAQGINLLYFLPAASAALPSHVKNGFVEKAILLPAILAGLLCAGLAAWLSNSLDIDLLRKCFGVFLLVIGLVELFRKSPPDDKKSRS